MATGLAIVVLVVGGALYLGSGASSDSVELPPEEAPVPAHQHPEKLEGPEFQVDPVDIDLGEEGAVESAEDESNDSDEGGLRPRLSSFPSDSILEMATKPHVQPASEEDDVRTYVRSLLPGAEQCWSRSAGSYRGTWNVFLRSGAQGLDSSKSRLRGLRDYKLKDCLTNVLKTADSSMIDEGVRAHCPVTLDPSDGVQMN